VTRTRFTGASGSKKPSNVNLRVSSRNDDTTPSGSDGNWSGTTNSFNGSSFSNGNWTMSITKPSGAGCSDFNGTSLSFEY